MSEVLKSTLHNKIQYLQIYYQGIRCVLLQLRREHYFVKKKNIGHHSNNIITWNHNQSVSGDHIKRLITYIYTHTHTQLHIQ